MKKTALFLILAIGLYVFGATDLCASGDNLYEMFEDYADIKVYLKDVVDETGNPAVKTDVFRDVFGDVMKDRINIDFVPAANEKDADVIVNCRIVDYVFHEKAIPYRPAPLFISAIAFIGDTAEPKSSAKLVIDYEVRRPEDNKVIYTYKRLTTEKRRPQDEMKGEMGYIQGLRENINRFAFRAFYKQSKN